MSHRLLGALVTVAVSVAAAAQAPTPVGDAQSRWWNHVKTLADDGLEGRQTGSDGYRRAAAYVAEQFQRAGLRPAGTNGFTQPVQFTRRRIVEAESSVVLVRAGSTETLRLGQDVTINLRAELAPAVEAPLVFAGYGLSAPEAGHDDLAGVDVKGKIVVYINGTPANLNGAQAAHFQNINIRWPLLKAAGAVGAMAILNPKTMEQPWERTSPARLNPVMTLVDPRFNDLAGMKLSASVNPASAERLFAGSNHRFADLIALAAERKVLPKFQLPSTLRVRIGLESAVIASDNVAAVLQGSDPQLSREHVVLSAHLDHIGVGNPVNGDRIYNGAMDNASGIATLLEVARQLSAAAPRPKRSVLFVAVTGEEHGLLGSRYFAGNPTVPKSSLVANINLDMFMPIVPMKALVVMGLEESDLGDRIRAIGKARGIDVGGDPEPERNRFTRSDQYSFIQQGVPALFPKIGSPAGSPEAAIEAQWTKERYHQPSDDLTQPVDFGAAVAFTDLMAALSADVANLATRPEWKPTSFFKRFKQAAN
jgi:Zn-dependent M28 family amino/carboxypeptidase